jgi:hypothetical protein
MVKRGISCVFLILFSILSIVLFSNFASAACSGTLRCDYLGTQFACDTTYGFYCYWEAGSCYNDASSCADIASETYCTSAIGCTWSACASHDSYECYNGDVYWYDSCGNREGIRTNCISPQICTNDACVNSPIGNCVGTLTCSNMDDYSCGNFYPACTVSGGLCVNAVGMDCGDLTDIQCHSVGCYLPSCTSHASSACFGGDVYWYDSCGNREGIRTDCNSAQICVGGACVAKSTTGICEDSPYINCNNIVNPATCGTTYAGYCYWEASSCYNAVAHCSDVPENLCEYTDIDCNWCSYHDSSACYAGDVWWFDCHGNPYEIRTDCTSGQSCCSGVCCAVGQFCSGGTCINACTNDCIVGDRQCSGSGYQTCGEYDGDGCTEWGGPVTTCNDNSVCTTDSCSAGACVYNPITCNDNNACTTNNCNALTGCYYNPITCNDNNACTTNNCDISSGCYYNPITCNDNNACTTNSCSTLTGCVYNPITCNDGEECTADSCNVASGCVFTPRTGSGCSSDGNECTNLMALPAHQIVMFAQQMFVLEEIVHIIL